MPYCRSKLRAAICQNDVKEVERILWDAGAHASDLIADDDSSNCLFGCLLRESDTPLHAAIMFRRTEICEVLLRHGADVEAVTSLQQTPLLMAARFDNVAAARLLVADFRANVFARGEFQRNALHLNAICKTPNARHNQAATSVMEYLLTVEGTHELVNEPDSHGGTPLHLACLNDNSHKVALLLQHGANLFVKNKRGWTGEDFAGKKARVVIKEHLQSIEESGCSG